MYELKTIIENGEVHYELHKKDGWNTFIESFDSSEYSQAVNKLRLLNCN